MERKEPNHTITNDGYRIKKLNNNVYSVINKEINVDIEIKIEETEDFETDLINLNPESEYRDAKDFQSRELYQNHVIKDELVIGPEEIQENIIDIPLYVYEDPQKNQAKTYQCTKCKETFRTKQTLHIHLKDVHALKLCQYCHKGFNKTSNLKRHQNYSCPYNESVAKNNELLKYGMFTHPFICDFCNKSYTHKNTLRNHIKSHMGFVTPLTYKCNLCEKSYTKRHNLKCHMRATHLKVKSYFCSYCKKGFSWRYGLTSHENTHHKNKKRRT